MTDLSIIELEEGIKVRLNYDFIVAHPSWPLLRKEYREWVTSHKDNIFTVKWDEYRKNNNTKDKKIMVCLKEDETDPQWLFHSSYLTVLPL